MKSLKIGLIFFFFGASVCVFGQTSKYRWAIGGNIGFRQYKGDVGNDWFRFDYIRPTGGILIGRYINPSFDFTLSGNASDLKYQKIFSAKITETALSLKFKTYNDRILKEKSKIAPYLTAGVGLIGVKSLIENKTAVNFPLGLGFRFRLSERTVLNLQSTVNLHSRIDYDGTEDANNSYLQHNFGLAVQFGKMKDEDKDGVPDAKDKCPDTPNYRVDKNGCPLDSDGDGVADSDDQCPDQAGKPALSGCPDTDNDGIADADDKCPEQAGKGNGCPDTDQDGVADADDKCPGIAGTRRMQGCPDKDDDGIIDTDDRCPDEAGTANLQGCPDKDNDGMSDLEDYCPNVAGLPENHGCPAIKDDNRTKLAAAAKNIQFETGLAVIDKKSYPELNNIAEILKQELGIRLMIEGHTDNSGSSAANKKLSQKRAEAVKKYLTDQGIATQRLTAEGFGDERPIADNKTAAGRTRNRRVDLVIRF